MKSIIYSILAILFISACTQESEVQRTSDFNFDWKFTLVEDTQLPNQLPLDDTQWRDVRLPHDWSVEFDFDSIYEGCTGYLPGGVGIYQKHFKTPCSLEKTSTYVMFDGVYNNANFWINGQHLGENPYGYSPVNWDLTKYLKTDGSDNILTVHVDHSRYADSRWYTGSGIYRNVKLVTVDKLHIPIWGTFVTTPEVSKSEATVRVEVKIENQYAEKKDYTLSTELIDANGTVVATKQSKLDIAANTDTEIVQNFDVANPKLWDCETPNMYKAVSSIIVDGKNIDAYTTPFGIRKIEFKVGEGFFLNEKDTYMKGICLHHDGGLVGTAVPKGVWKRRLQKLKDAGVNAIRTSHNPYSEEFLDLCDEMGFLVQNEIFDELDYAKDKRLNKHDRNDDYITRGYDEHFHEWNKSDLSRTMYRDRNHPSVVQWSIGNEIEWTYLHYRYITGFWPDPNDPEKSKGFWGAAPMYSPEELKERYDNWDKGEFILAETAREINGWVKEIDKTRPTTANLIIPQVSHVSGYADAVDIAGYSYRNSIFEWGHEHFPHKQLTINECPGTWDDWNQVTKYPGVFSMFMWTGIDYIGESHNKWPGRRPWGDMLDLAGFEDTGYNYFKSIWKDESHISIATNPLEGSAFKMDKKTNKAIAKNQNSYKWKNVNDHWNYTRDENIIVEVCSNYESIELFLNGKSLGTRERNETPDWLMRWVVPFVEGTLEAKGVANGKTETVTLKTAQKPEKSTIDIDNKTMKADAYDVAHIVVQLVDKDGVPVKTENTKVNFTIDGPAKLLGVDCANHHKHQPFQSNSVETYKGRCLAIIQSTKEAGEIKVTVDADGFETQTATIESK